MILRLHLKIKNSQHSTIPTLKNARTPFVKARSVPDNTGNIYHYPIEAIKTLLEPYLPTHLVALPALWHTLKTN